MSRVLPLTENYTPSQTGAGKMRDRCAFTSRDMAADWPEAFTYAIVVGWDGYPEDDIDESWTDVARRYGWDDALVSFLKDAHERFKALGDLLAGGL